MSELTYRNFDVPYSDKAVKIKEISSPMKTCSDIRVSCPQPELAKHTRYEADELLRELLKPNPISATIMGIGGSGKSSLM